MTSQFGFPFFLRRGLVALKTKNRTVKHVKLFTASTNAGQFTLQDELDIEQRELVASRFTMFVDDDNFDEDDLDNDDSDLVDLDEEGDGSWVMIEVWDGATQAGWWFTDGACLQHVNCRCSVIPLIEVLEQLKPSERSEALEAHVALQQRVWQHFWSADAFVCGDEELGDVCASCLIDGESHVTELRVVAETLGIELAEAVAAHNLAVSYHVGEHPGRDT